MNNFFHINPFNFHILLEIFVFLGDIYQSSSSLTYRHSSNPCKGEDLGEKGGCKCDGNERLGRIIDSASLQEVKNVISDDKPYWIGLSYEKGKGFCWITEKYDRCDERPADQKSLTNIIYGEKEDWKPGWYCFLVRKSEVKMKAKNCHDNERFLCETGNNSINYFSCRVTQCEMKH
ncbi:uncharacterized protein LOC111347402 [Stylophora pistillata]|uniref:uncharacterized protein LOC111347402 n=1 Tax=Stylophora pistillata TaxID=50429 RepID=UPI000C0506BD|nr:uncharacterized protein LOC111347402 [Stylophora pistillata]